MFAAGAMKVFYNNYKEYTRVLCPAMALWGVGLQYSNYVHNYTEVVGHDGTMYRCLLSHTKMYYMAACKCWGPVQIH